MPSTRAPSAVTRSVSGETSALQASPSMRHDREADAAGGDAVAERKLGRKRRPDGEALPARHGRQREHGAGGFNQSRKHLLP